MRRAAATPSAPTSPGTFNVAGDGVLMLSQAVRRLQRPVGARCRPSAVGGVGSVLRSRPGRRLLAGAARLPHLRSRGRHHPDARGARLRAGVHHRRGVRRLRRGADARPAAASSGSLGGARPPAAGRRAPAAIRQAEPPWVTPRSSRSAPAAAPAAAPGSGSAVRGVAQPGRRRRASRPRRKAAPRSGRRSPPRPSGPSADRPPRRRARGRRGARAPAYAEDRGPLGGIPAGDWLAAFQHAARELFGDQWEPQLARFLAFLRRRLTGDYVVDEYGFDQEITERFFMAALRPIAREVVPHRGARRREHPGRGRRAGGLQPLRHASRSTA